MHNLHDKAKIDQCPKINCGISDEIVNGIKPWFCDGACTENIKKRRIVVELPRKRLPLMCSPKSTSDATKPKTVVRSESPRKPQTRKTAKSLPTYETKPHRRTTSKTESVARNTTSLADQESYSDISSSRRVAPRSGGKNLTHYALLSRTANYYEASSDSSEDA
ncbi:hypothetical protein K7432_016498 [Basidiobolus ranarum]|uniref:Uncharacterized protein n=1 Tax=Basidiobolus ranarum TaxID=34480 RepID=A0ABR2WEL8_9FUNG